MPAASRTLPSRNGRGADARSQKRPDFAGQRNRPHRHGCQDDPLSSSRGRRVYLRMLRRFPCSIDPKSSEEGDSPIQSCCGEKRAMVSSLYSIVAVCKNMGIGKDGRLPWPPLRNEYKHFQKMTMTTKGEGKQNVVIMGRKTWFSIPEKHRPLKNRINVVLSKELKDVPEGAHYLAKSLEEALDHLETPEMKRKVDKVWIIGGSSVYKAAMEKPIHQHLFVTRILHEFESDTFFPEIDLKKYRLLPNYTGISVDIQEENGIQYKFEVYENII